VPVTGRAGIRSGLALDLDRVSQREVGRVLPSDRPVVVGDYDIGMVVTFRDEASMKAYLVDPRHLQLVKDVLEPLADMSKTKVYDFVNHE